MIPSRNDGIEDRAKKAMASWRQLNTEWDLDPEGFAKKHGMANANERPRELTFGPDLKLVCDCCGRVLDWGAQCFVLGEYNERHYADRYVGFVRVLDKIYYGCRVECATALFTIHHQYAMTEKKTDSTERCQ